MDERRVELAVAAQFIADAYAGELTPRQTEQLYAMRALLEHDADALTTMQAREATLIRLVRQYVDPFNVAHADHALVLAIGTDDKAGIEEALATSDLAED